MDTVELLKVLADETRLRILNIVAAAGDLCACEVEAVLGLSQSNTSRHLARLRRSGVLVATRSGHWIHYAISGEGGGRRGLVDATIASGRRDLPPLAEDLVRLDGYRESGFSCETIREWRSGAEPVS